MFFIAPIPESHFRVAKSRAYRLSHGFHTVEVKIIEKLQDTSEEETKEELEKVEDQEMGEAAGMVAASAPDHGW